MLGKEIKNIEQGLFVNYYSKENKDKYKLFNRTHKYLELSTL